MPVTHQHASSHDGEESATGGEAERHERRKGAAAASSDHVHGGAYLGLFRPSGGDPETPEAEMGFHMCVAVIPSGSGVAIAEERDVPLPPVERRGVRDPGRVEVGVQGPGLFGRYE